jgi:hypothetical protein
MAARGVWDATRCLRDSTTSMVMNRYSGPLANNTIRVWVHVCATLCPESLGAADRGAAFVVVCY